MKAFILKVIYPILLRCENLCKYVQLLHVLLALAFKGITLVV